MKFMVYHWKPNEIIGVPLESYINLWCTTGILEPSDPRQPGKSQIQIRTPWCTTGIRMKLMVYRWKPNEIHGVPLESCTKLWRTTGILCKWMVYNWNPIKNMVYHWNPNKIYGVPLESYINLWYNTGILYKFMVYHWNPRTPAGPENLQSKCGPP